jgi:hypothetical protein
MAWSTRPGGIMLYNPGTKPENDEPASAWCQKQEFEPNKSKYISCFQIIHSINQSFTKNHFPPTSHLKVFHLTSSLSKNNHDPFQLFLGNY